MAKVQSFELQGSKAFSLEEIYGAEDARSFERMDRIKELTYFIGLWLRDSGFDLRGAVLECSLVTGSNTRFRVDNAPDELKKLLKEDGTDGRVRWEHGDYDFRFGEDKFFWKGKRIHLTDSEAFFLYTVLVKSTAQLDSFYLGCIQARVGKQFLKDVQKERTI